MADEVTSSDVNISSSNSSSINTTTIETLKGGLKGHVMLVPQSVIVRVIILGTLAVFNVCGNGFTLITIRLTPRLWTKTNFILASMLVADVITGLFMFWYMSLILIVYYFNNPCNYNVLITALTPFMKMTPYAGLYHLLLMCIERFVAIVYPLKYETKFTDRTLKWSIAAAWVMGILVGMTYSFWLINADLRKCDLIPVPYHLLDVVGAYVPVCISMHIVYGKILVIWWHQRKSIHPIKVSPASTGGVSGQATTSSSLSATHSNIDTSQDAKDKPLVSTGPPTRPTPATSADVAAEQQRQQIKARRREFKAVYLTAAIVGMFVILWIPHMLGRILGPAGYDLSLIHI